jgi:hypothetical protein
MIVAHLKIYAEHNWFATRSTLSQRFRKVVWNLALHRAERFLRAPASAGARAGAGGAQNVKTNHLSDARAMS